MKIIAAIQSRMGSTRFPDKVMKDLCGKPVLQWVIEKAQGMDVEDIILLTSIEYENRIIHELAIRNKMRCYGHQIMTFYDLECFSWFYQITKYCNADYIIRICGDSPFIDAALTNIMISKIRNSDHEYDYASYEIDGVPAILTLYGIFVEIVSVKQLKVIMEHTTPQFYTDYNRMMLSWHMPYKYKLSIDYPEDLERAKKVIELNGGMPGYKDINRIMKENHELQWKGECKQKYGWSK